MTIYAVDLDGTLVEDNKWPLMGDWLPGAQTALKVLLRHGKVIIHSLRVNPYEFGYDGDPDHMRPFDEVVEEIANIRRMLDDAGLQAVHIHTTHGKPAADYYIDNRAVEFDGKWGKVLKKLGVEKDVTGVLGEYLDESIKRQVQRDIAEGPPSFRVFETGATRDTDEGKLDYEAFFSPLVLKRRAEYMHKHRVQAGGSLRDGDNWQKGIPKDQYIKSAWRHFYDWWFVHRRQGHVLGYKVNLVESICALMFNCEGYLHELLKEGSDG